MLYKQNTNEGAFTRFCNCIGAPLSVLVYLQFKFLETLSAVKSDTLCDIKLAKISKDGVSMNNGFKFE